MPQIDIALVDDDVLFRQGFEKILASSQSFRCVASFDSGEEALAQLPHRPVSLVLIDIQMPGLDGIELIRQLTQLELNLIPIVLTVHEDTERIFQSLRAGAYGYLVKTTPAPELLLALQEVAQGGAAMSRSIARKVIQHFHNNPATPDQDLSRLTAREKEILDRLTQGLIYKEIAGQLGISTETVKAHLRNIYRKLQVTSRSEAMLKAMRS